MALFPAGDTEPDEFRTWHITFNMQSWFLYALQGAFALMSSEGNWDTFGDATADFAADIARDMMLTFKPGVNMIGVCVPFAGDTANIPPEGLYCDGSSLLRADYPDLFTTIGTNWCSVDGTHFNIPDLRGVTVIGAGSGSGLTPRSLASITGEEAHTLTVAEMPTHNHAIQDFLMTGTAVPPPLDAGAEIPHLINTTANEGGGGSHNNMQPSTALNYYIIAKA